MKDIFAEMGKRFNEIVYGNDGTTQEQDPDNPDAVRITRPNGDVDVYHKTTGELLSHTDILDAEYLSDE